MSLLAISAVVFGVDRLANSASIAASGSPSTGPIGSSPEMGVVPWIDATPPPSTEPAPEPTIDPTSVTPCTADDLAVSAWGWDGATGSLGGGATLINMSVDPCRVAGKPGVHLFSKKGDAIVEGEAAEPDAGPAVVLRQGDQARVFTVWMNWCGDPPTRPLFVRLSLPGGGGTLRTAIRERAGTETTQPRCDVPQARSTFGVAVPFSPPEPSSADYEPAACAADDLAGYLGGWGAGLGSSYASAVVLNVGGFDCLLATSPALELRDADGRLLVNGERWPVGEATFVLPAGWAALTTVQFANWCLAPPKLPFNFDLLVGTAKLKLAPTSERSIMGPPTCMSGSQTPPPSLGYTGPFRIPGVPEPPEPNPVDSLPLRVEALVLPPIRPGETLVFTVTLTNDSPFGKPMNLAALCPAYTERLFLPNNRQSVDRQLVLNCANVGVLSAGASLAFEMRLPIPPDAPSGTATLVWQLGDRGPGFKAAFDITP